MSCGPTGAGRLDGGLDVDRLYWGHVSRFQSTRQYPPDGRGPVWAEARGAAVNLILAGAERALAAPRGFSQRVLRRSERCDGWLRRKVQAAYMRFGQNKVLHSVYEAGVTV